MKTIRLQWVGYKPAKFVKELRAGDKIMWNGGYTSTVLDLLPSKSGKTIAAVLRESESDCVVERKMRADRLVAVI